MTETYISPSQVATQEIFLEPAENQRLQSLCGPFDDNIKLLERRLGTEISRRDNRFRLTGKPHCVKAAAAILRQLYVETAPVRGVIRDIDPSRFTWPWQRAVYWNRVTNMCRTTVNPSISKPNAVWLNRARQTRHSISPTFSTTISPSVSPCRDRKTYRRSPLLWMLWSVRKSAASC